MKNLKTIFLGASFFVSMMSFSQNVNEFTGSLSYGLPLINIPSNRGNGVPIEAYYNAGIGVKQSASDIGLGWSLSAGGAITRNVSGLADDCVGCSVWDDAAKTFRTENGMLYVPGDADIYRTKRNMDSVDFMFPDYDGYYVSGPGIGGRMTPNIFDYKLFEKTTGSNNRYAINANSVTRSPQFHFSGDFADTLISRHYSVTPVSSSTPFKIPTDNISGLVYGGTPQPYLGKSASGAENYDPTTNRLGSANYIEYFRNGQIDTANGAITGFIDFQSSHGRNSTDYPVAGIGAFRITNPSGFVYHYSLPVYVTKVEIHSYPLENDYSIPSYSATLNSYGASSSYV